MAIELEKVTLHFTPKACASRGTLVELTNPSSQKNPKTRSNPRYVGTLLELYICCHLLLLQLFTCHAINQFLQPRFVCLLKLIWQSLCLMQI